MFHIFTDESRRVVVIAGETASRLGSDRIRCEHLLLGVRQVESFAADVLERHHVTSEQLFGAMVDWFGTTGGDALQEVGISLSEVQRAADAAFGDDALRSIGPPWTHIPFSLHAKRALERTIPELQARTA